MASGVKVADSVKDIFNAMKVVKNNDDSNERIRIVTLVIEGDYIDIESTYREKDLADEPDHFKFFINLLKPDQCRYVLYDCHYATKESSKKEELVFATWCPDSGNLKQRMLYASSKSAIKQLVLGLKHDLQMNDLVEYGTRDGFAEKLGKNAIAIEGHPV